LRVLLLTSLLWLSIVGSAWGNVDLNGDADYLSVADHADFTFGDGTNDSPFAVSLWVNADDWTSHGVVSKWETDGVDNHEWLLFTNGSDKLYFVVYDNSTAGYRGRSYNTAITGYQGSWIHIVATYDGVSATIVDRIDIYINGIAVDDQDFTANNYTAMEDKDVPFEVGSYNNGLNNLDGKITEVAVFSKDLSQRDVTNLYSGVRGMPTQIGSLIAYWTLDDITEGHTGLGADTWGDRSGNGHTITGTDGDGDSTTIGGWLSYPPGVM